MLLPLCMMHGSLCSRASGCCINTARPVVVKAKAAAYAQHRAALHGAKATEAVSAEVFLHIGPQTIVPLTAPCTLCHLLLPCQAVSARTFHGTPSEGLNALPQHMWVMRQSTCLVILIRAAVFGFQLLRSPPHSGKTSLLQLLKHVVDTVSVLRCGESWSILIAT